MVKLGFTGVYIMFSIFAPKVWNQPGASLHLLGDHFVSKISCDLSLLHVQNTARYQL